MLVAAICDKVAETEAESDDDGAADRWIGGTARWLWQGGADRGPLQSGRGHFEAGVGTSVFNVYAAGGLECDPVAELITSGLHCVGHYCVGEESEACRFASVDEVLRRVEPHMRRSPRLRAAVAAVLAELESMTEPEGELQVRRPAMGGSAEATEDGRRAREQAERVHKVAALKTKLEGEVSKEGRAGGTDEGRGRAL